MKKKNVLMVFMKYPMKGRVKTRLAKDIGDEKALEIYKSLVEDTVNGIRDNKESYDLVIYLDSEANIREASRWLGISAASFAVQSGADLGEKLTNAFAEQFGRSGVGRVAVIGTDIPGIVAGNIENALGILDSADVVIGPASDGGYYLIGLKAPEPSLFQGVEWSTDMVLKQTLAKASLANLTAALIEEKRDIDTVEDLKALNYKLPL